MTKQELKVLTEAVRWYKRVEKAKTATEENEFAHIESIQEAEDKLLRAIERLIKIK